jgi:hypothetical protein
MLGFSSSAWCDRFYEQLDTLMGLLEVLPTRPSTPQGKLIPPHTGALAACVPSSYADYLQIGFNLGVAGRTMPRLQKLPKRHRMQNSLCSEPQTIANEFLDYNLSALLRFILTQPASKQTALAQAVIQF